MHDLEFEHLHVDPSEGPLNEVAWAADNVELTTVGIDIGSSTSHLMFARVHLQRLVQRAVEPLRRGRPQAAVAIADPAHALPARLHHRRRRARGLHRRRLCLRRDRAPRGRLRRGDPDRRGDQAQERARHRRPVLGGGRQVRLRLGRPPDGVPAFGARLGRGRALARARRDAAQRRHRRRHHQAHADRERPDPRHRRHRGRRAADRRRRQRRRDASRAPGHRRRRGRSGSSLRLAGRLRPRIASASPSAWRACSWA